MLGELRRIGFATIEEPGRRIVMTELESGGSSLPWIDAVAFCRRTIELSLADREHAAKQTGPVFFDRSLIDATAELQRLTGELTVEKLNREHRYAKTVFMAPPWPEIFCTDNERRHGLSEGIAEFDRLLRVYPALGYRVRILPKVPALRRVEFVVAELGLC